MSSDDDHQDGASASDDDHLDGRLGQSGPLEGRDDFEGVPLFSTDESRVFYGEKSNKGEVRDRFFEETKGSGDNCVSMVVNDPFLLPNARGRSSFWAYFTKGNGSITSCVFGCVQLHMEGGEQNPELLNALEDINSKHRWARAVNGFLMRGGKTKASDMKDIVETRDGAGARDKNWVLVVLDYTDESRGGVLSVTCPRADGIRINNEECIPLNEGGDGMVVAENLPPGCALFAEAIGAKVFFADPRTTAASTVKSARKR